MKKISRVLLCVTLGILMFASYRSDAAEKYSFKMSTSTSDTSTWTLAANKFAELVSERTGGNIKIRVYPSDQLSGGNQAKGIELLANGSTDFTFHSNLVYSVMDNRFNVLSLPFLIKDDADADAKMAGPGGEKLKGILEEKGIIGLGFGENGFRQITNSKKEVKSVDDMKGLKFRVNNSKMLISTYQAMGADPLSMNFSEVFTSLQQGTIDGQENPLDVIDSSKLYEVQGYISLWGCTYDTIILGMNKATFDKLGEDYQKIIRESAEEACIYQKRINRERGEEQLNRFKESGLVVTVKNDLDIVSFKNAVQGVYSEYEPIIGKDLLDLFR
ncbi:ABC transporter substrate-binding protein [Synergistales bacterium]|nr:ABC transporter substrate-binding protein [Synergistales bacterium]